MEGINIEYYNEILHYADICKWQQTNCNLGTKLYSETPWDDTLVKNVFIYDCFNRKYAGFNQILLDLWHSKNKLEHPYFHKLTKDRIKLIDSFNTGNWGIEAWLYVFFVHRLTGSGINYAKNPSGYHNSVLPYFNQCENLEDMVDVIKKSSGRKIYTSGGYQIAMFSKQDKYNRHGDYFLIHMLPKLIDKFSNLLYSRKRNFRELMPVLADFNRSINSKIFWFPYAAVLADIADFLPNLINRDSLFFYGSNAVKSFNLVGKDHDAITRKLQEDTGLMPYEIEDSLACDFWRWHTCYVNTKPGSAYEHLDLSKIYNSSRIL
jgi:hypothetical protein